MEKFIIAIFNAFKGPVAVDSILAYETAPTGERIARFLGRDGKTYIAALDEIQLREATMLKVA
jgi:hypothetical protein